MFKFEKNENSNSLEGKSTNITAEKNHYNYRNKREIEQKQNSNENKSKFDNYQYNQNKIINMNNVGYPQILESKNLGQMMNNSEQNFYQNNWLYYKEKNNNQNSNYYNKNKNKQKFIPNKKYKNSGINYTNNNNNINNLNNINDITGFIPNNFQYDDSKKNIMPNNSNNNFKDKNIFYYGLPMNNGNFNNVNNVNFTMDKKDMNNNNHKFIKFRKDNNQINKGRKANYIESIIHNKQNNKFDNNNNIYENICDKNDKYIFPKFQGDNLITINEPNNNNNIIFNQNYSNNNNIINKKTKKELSKPKKKLFQNMCIKIGTKNNEKEMTINLNDNVNNIVNNIIEENKLELNCYEPLVNIIENSLDILNNFEEFEPVKEYVNSLNQNNDYNSKDVDNPQNVNDSFINELIEFNCFNNDFKNIMLESNEVWKNLNKTFSFYPIKKDSCIK